ncbi:MAG TPA: hypothetical protein VGJ70_22590, partial [Solirubrobacteraceae bacterium]
FRGGQPVTVVAEGAVEAPSSLTWEDVSAAGLNTEVLEPLRRWRLQFAGDDASFDLSLEAVGAIAELPPEHPAAQAGGMAGYEQLVHVEGSATVGSARLEVRALGQRGHSWGAPDWERIDLARTLSAWLGDDLALTAVAIRPHRAETHAGELIAATLLEPAGDNGAGAPTAVPVEDPRLSTTYDAGGHQRHAGLELWVGKEDRYARHVAGEALCGTSLDLGRLRLDCAFFRWRTQGREGVGRYDIVRRAAAAG